MKNIQLADKDNLDVIICGRGGGSIEDLWPFNEEIVARAFYNCNTPIISAVGHEIDTTISDYVADARGLTPTDGAMKATPNLIDVINKINDLKNQLNVNMNNYIKLLKTEVNNLKTSYVLTNPTKIYENYRYKIDELESTLMSIFNKTISETKLHIVTDKQKLNTLMTNKLNKSRNEFINSTSKLDGLSPLKVLNRGYAFVTINEKVIKKTDDISIDEEIKLSLVDGNVKAKVISKEKN